MSIAPVSYTHLDVYKRQRIAQGLHLTSGLRYDLGYIAMSPYHDTYLADYLQERGESSATLAQYYYSSQEGERRWHDLSGSCLLYTSRCV